MSSDYELTEVEARADQTAKIVADLRAIPVDEIIDMMEGCFIGDTAKVFAKYIENRYPAGAR